MVSGDERTRRDYRAATAAVDERPSAAARSAILAAAAREVKSQPQAAGALPRRRAAARWPMAAAAAVLLSTLAGLVAVRTEREMPSFSEPTASGPPVAVNSAPAPMQPAEPVPATAPATSPVQSDVPRSDERQRAPVPPAPLNRGARADAAAPAQLAVPPAKPAEAEAPRDAGRPTQKVLSPEATDQRANAKEEAAPRAQAMETPSAGARAPAAEPSRAEAPAIAPAPAAREKKDGVATLAKTRQPDSRGADVATGTLGAAAPSTSASETDATSVLSADQWLEKIIRLRRSGQHADADAELKQFRERYPQVQVPPEAIGPSGTR